MGINKLENITCKSFNNFSSEEKLSNVNIFFGTNGSGKSALSQWIKINYSSVTKIFDTEYVSDNILAKDEIVGVRLTVGQEAINIEEMIDSIIDANSNIEMTISKIQDEVNLRKGKIFEILDTTLKQAKVQFSLNTNINQKANAVEKPMAAYERWINDIDENNESEIGSSKELEQRKMIIKEERSRLINIPITDERIVQDIFDKLPDAIVPPNDQMSTKLVEWLKEGYLHHDMENGQEKCQFCDSSFNTLEVKKRIDTKLNSEHTKYMSKLVSFLDDLTKTKSILTDIPCIDVTDYQELVDKLIIIIEKKKDNTALQMEKVLVDYEKLIKINDLIEKRKEVLFEEEKEIDRQLFKIESVAKSWIGKQLRANNNINSISNEMKRLEIDIEEYMILLNQNQQWILEQQKSNSDLKPFRDLVNKQFNALGVDFELEIMDSGTHYLIKHRKTKNPIMTKDLSEGERRLLGFLHFYFDLFDRPDESFMTNIEMIVIDDPITSLDSDNRYYLTELINNFIKRGITLNKQLFIFTHSSLDFHNFGYAVKSNISFWRISKDLVGNSEIHKVIADERKNYSNYYQMNFRSIFEFAILGRGKLPQDNFVHYGNKARLVLESHARSHYQIEYATNQNCKQLVEVYEIEEDSINEFRRMLDVINSLSHGMTFIDENPISSIEVQSNIRYLLSVLYRKDKYHIEKMAGSILNKRNEKDILIWLNKNYLASKTKSSFG
ncbi:AAA family ATPase [Enterococcus casseliflavus]|uniref:AAA family ATPase n=1 Tax=Enterococcus casseliflavus TaxID=37734 RepID=UPI003D0CC5A0